MLTSTQIEIDLYCELTPRQRYLYKALRSNSSVADLLRQATYIGTDTSVISSLMNLVMQFRKVCNHPELFERADVRAPFSFAKFAGTSNLLREGDFVEVPYSTRNPIEFQIPQLFYEDVSASVSHSDTKLISIGRISRCAQRDHSIRVEEPMVWLRGKHMEQGLDS